MFRRARGEPMPAQFEELAVYNAEVSRGIVHTTEWQVRMAELQCRFDAWSRNKAWT